MSPCIAYLPLQTLTLFPTDEMESWQLRFQNGTTVTGAGMPPELWVKQPAKEKKETKGALDNRKGFRNMNAANGNMNMNAGKGNRNSGKRKPIRVIRLQG